MARFKWMQKELEDLNGQHLLRRLLITESAYGPWATVEKKRLLLICSNNYLGLANDPRLVQAAQDATAKYGVGAGAARLICGNLPVHVELENALAHFKGTESALLFSTGYMANMGLLGALPKKGDVIFCDRLAHASIIDGCLLSPARMVRYRHNRMEHLDDLLRNTPCSGRRWIVTEGVFSMDGDIVPLPELVQVAERHDAVIILDEAHSTGVLGRGRGTVEHFGCPADRIIQMGTLGKALGGFGAFVAAERLVIDYLINSARSFIFTTALLPSTAASALEALRIVESEPERLARLGANASILRNGLRAIGFEVPDGETPIIPVMVGDAERALSLSHALFNEGVYATAVRPPTVPKGESRIRVTVMATHTNEDIEFALQAFEKAGRKVGLL